MRDIDLLNSENLTRWRCRWAVQGGSAHWHAHPLPDLRIEEDKRRYRLIEHLRRSALKSGRKVKKVINLAHERFERKRRRIEASRHGL